MRTISKCLANSDLVFGYRDFVFDIGQSRSYPDIYETDFDRKDVVTRINKYLLPSLDHFRIVTDSLERNISFKLLLQIQWEHIMDQQFTEPRIIEDSTAIPSPIAQIFNIPKNLIPVFQFCHDLKTRVN